MKPINSQTYKDQYHFTDDYQDIAKENPSINGHSKINTTIKENPYRSNVEIEGGELVLQPDLSALFKASGKKHSSGGMDVLLKPNSFVFSDFKDLSIKDSDKELFELKLGGSSSPTKNTPAEVVKKNVDVKHYNTLIDNISNPHKDELARKSSAMMLEKYIQTLGNIAFIQERKKGFPDGLPDFSLGTAPVFDPSVKDEVSESKQYAKYGGNVMAEGGPFDGECPCGKDNKGNCLPCTPEQLAELSKKATMGTLADVKGMNKIGSIKNTDYYHTGTDGVSGTFDINNKNVKRANVPNDVYLKSLNQYNQYSGEEMARNKLIHPSLINEWNLKYRKAIPETDKFVAIKNMPNVSNFDFRVKDKPVTSPNPEAGQVQGEQQGMKTADWQFTPWQKLSQLYNWGQYANVRRYMPFRSRYNATYADPSLLNPEQTIGDVKGQVTQQLSALGTLNPIMRNAQAAASFGAALNQIPAIRTQYDNQNAQIQNQFRQYNNQVRNNESMVNMQNDQQYYQQAVTGRTNFDNMRSYTANNAMNNVLGDVQTNQKLAYNLLTQNNPAYSFDWKTGNFSRNPMNIKDIQGSGENDVYDEFFKSLSSASTTEELQRMKIWGDALKAKNILPYLKQQSSPFQKKGGKTKNPYRY